MPYFRIFALTCAIALAPLAARAEEEIVFRFTEEQAKEACKVTGQKGFEAITSDDGNYTLNCLWGAYEDSEGRSHPDHWMFLRKGEIVLDGIKRPSWHVVVVEETPEAEAQQ